MSVTAVITGVSPETEVTFKTYLDEVIFHQPSQICVYKLEKSFVTSCPLPSTLFISPVKADVPVLRPAFALPPARVT